MERIRYCCLKLEEWGGGVNQEFKRKIQECRHKLRKFRARRDSHGIQIYNEVRWEFLNLLEKKEVYWRQRAKQFWLQNGDQNTKFYHSFASGRKKTNGFQRIKYGRGEWKETEKEIQNVVTDYFSQVFQSSGTSGSLSEREKVCTVTEEQNNDLVDVITPEEVKEAVFSMHLEKSPGTMD